MAVITVNGAAMPAPSTLKVTIFDVASTADRNASGQVVMDRVGTKRKLEMTWAHLTPAQLSQLLQAVGADVFFTAGYPDPQTAQMRTMTCYCGDRTGGILRMISGAPVWTNIEMNWIER